MKILLDIVIKLIIIIIMLKAMHLLDDNKNKIIIIALIYLASNYLMLSTYITENTIIRFIYYLINIFISASLCIKINEGLFYSLIFYTTEAIINSITLYISIYINDQFHQIMPEITYIICACLLIVAKKINLIKYENNNYLLYAINVICFFVAIFFNFYMTINYQLMPNIYYLGFIILGISFILNGAICSKMKKH